MACLSIYKDGCADATVISNVFLDEYMKDANDAQLKVYLYLVRMMNTNQTFGISDIADLFNHTEKDVLRALLYWEKRNVLSLDFDAGKNLTGIHILELSRSSAPPAQEEPQPIPIAALIPDRKSETPSEHPEAASPFAKPSYSLDDLRSFRSRDNTSQLLFIAEQYLGRTLSPADMKSVLFFTDQLHFSDDLIDYLLQYCVERGKRDFRYIEKVAVSWAEAGVKTPADAAGQSAKYDKSVYTIMNALGKNTSPTRGEVEFIRRWSQEYGFSIDLILEACGRTVLATDKHRFEYADKILSSWKSSGVHHLTDVARADASFQKEKPVSRQPARTSVEKYNRFMQNSYDFDALEKKLLE